MYIVITLAIKILFAQYALCLESEAFVEFYRTIVIRKRLTTQLMQPHFSKCIV